MFLLVAVHAQDFELVWFHKQTFTDIGYNPIPYDTVLVVDFDLNLFTFRYGLFAPASLARIACQFHSLTTLP